MGIGELWDRFVAAPANKQYFAAFIVLLLLAGLTTSIEVSGIIIGVDPALKFVFIGFAASSWATSVAFAWIKGEKDGKAAELRAERDFILRQRKAREDIIMSKGDEAVLGYIREHGPVSEYQLASSQLEYPKQYDLETIRGLWVVMKADRLHRYGLVRKESGVFSIREDNVNDPTKFRDETTEVKD